MKRTRLTDGQILKIYKVSTYNNQKLDFFIFSSTNLGKQLAKKIQITVSIRSQLFTSYRSVSFFAIRTTLNEMGKLG